MRMQGKSVLLAGSIALLALAGGGIGCSTPYRMAGRYTDDILVSRRVKEALENDPVHKYQFVNVDVFRGVVQLNGWTGTEEQRRVAGQIAAGVPGVRQIINSISLVPGPDGQIPTPTGRSENGQRAEK